MTIDEVAAFLSGRDGFILSSHEGPDADGLGAEYALARALSSLGKRVRIINANRHSDTYNFIDRAGIIECIEDAPLSEDELRTSTCVLLDTNDMMYAGEVADRVISKAKEFIIVDHHEVKGAAPPNVCSEPGYSSTCEMLYLLLKRLGHAFTEETATALFAGMVYDTGSFAYSKTSAATFEAALELVRSGASPSRIHGALYESSAVNVLLLRKDVLATLELFSDNRIAVQTLTSGMLAETGSSSQDAEGLINVPLQAAAVEVSIFLKENEEGMLRCSLRSKGAINVAQIAQSFGGGGHRSAAGFKSPYPLDTIKGRVLELVAIALAERQDTD